MSAAQFLCLACSSSLPPRYATAQPGTSKDIRNGEESGVFITSCCNRPICPACLSSNPRLARYNPCLHCLGGTDVVNMRHAFQKSSFKAHMKPQDSMNVDGGVHDADVFTLGDDEEDEEFDESSPASPASKSDLTEGSESATSTPPPAYDESPAETLRRSNSKLPDLGIDEEASQTHLPSKYYIQPGDTLIGIALKHKVDGRLLCRLNGLPPSTLRTTPHLLHTRTVLDLPPSTVPPPSSASLNTASENDPSYEARRARERAEKRFQTLTKEVDWRVAKAYVALADPEIEAAEVTERWKEGEEVKLKRAATSEQGTGLSLEASAIGRYLDDEEWERRQRQEGRGVSVPRFPLFDANCVGVGGKKPTSARLWSGWKWN